MDSRLRGNDVGEFAEIAQGEHMPSKSHTWYQKHTSDPYVKRAQKEGYRSRAVYKLLEIQEKDRLIKPGMTLVDLGSAPGGWSQVAVKLVGKKGRAIALDILPMDPIEGVEFIQGDFREEAILVQLLATLQETPVDIIISDLAPNISGMAVVDIPRSIYLAELALELAQQVLKPKGTLVMKVFQGEGFEGLLKSLRTQFTKVVSRKPAASKSKSKELYLVSTGYKGS